MKKIAKTRMTLEDRLIMKIGALAKVMAFVGP